MARAQGILRAGSPEARLKEKQLDRLGDLLRGRNVNSLLIERVARYFTGLYNKHTAIAWNDVKMLRNEHFLLSLPEVRYAIYHADLDRISKYPCSKFLYRYVCLSRVAVLYETGAATAGGGGVTLDLDGDHAGAAAQRAVLYGDG
eukprot:COSAG05_NODE_436_length_9838_cov_49.389876_9_plen_145_part_00